MDCQKEQNLKDCTCTAMACSRRGVCCECVTNHRAKNQLPGCFFPPDAEKTFDRSFKAFAKAWGL